MNRPILIVLIGYIIGIIWGLYIKINIVSFYIFLLIIYIIINFKYHKKKFKILSIKRYFRYIKLFFKVNIILTIIISSFISNIIIKINENKYKNSCYNNENLKITAIVIGNKEEKEYYNRYKIKIIESNLKNSQMYLTIKKNQELKFGDKVMIQGKFKEPAESRNYKGFNYKQYLKSLKIYGTIQSEKVEILEHNQINIISRCINNLCLIAKENIRKTYNEQTSEIILGIMLGDTTKISDEVKSDFSSSSISHVLAVSGLHISYIIILVTNSTQWIFGKRKSKIIASVILLLYMAITGFSVSVVRASIMGILLCMSFVLYRKSDTINNIAISAMVILINNPYSIVNLSFLLTYGGTIGIIFFKETIEKIIKNIKIKNRKWRYTFIKIQRKCEGIISTLAVSISAQIVIAPIMIIYFNTIGINFLITNLLLSYVIGVIVIGGFIQILVTFISIRAGVALAQIIQVPVYGVIAISKIKFGNFKVTTPCFYQIVLYYLFIFLFKLLYNIFHQKNCSITCERIKNTIYLLKYIIKPYLKKCKIIIIIIVILANLIYKMPHNLKIHFIDVGQGDSSLIVTPYNKKILIDGGGSNTYDVGENILVPYLFDRKIKKIDYIIISHFDQDHVRWNF